MLFDVVSQVVPVCQAVSCSYYLTNCCLLRTFLCQNSVGSGFLEPVYQEALEIESTSRLLPFVSQKILHITYKDCLLQKEYIADFVYYNQIIVELKALDKLAGREESQILNYLKATKMKVGLLINFGSSPKLEWKRFVY